MDTMNPTIQDVMVLFINFAFTLVTGVLVALFGLLPTLVDQIVACLADAIT
ncbi:MAG: hypothetical protein L6Q92_04585 [Phycisphaerae bacterium]|nr:hypothetical protein [Phycisphaerae bacterium]